MLRYGLCAGWKKIPNVLGYIFEQNVGLKTIEMVEIEAFTKLQHIFDKTTTAPIQGANIIFTDYSDIGHMLYRGCLNVFVEKRDSSIALVAVLNACRKLGISVVVSHIGDLVEEQEVIL